MAYICNDSPQIMSGDIVTFCYRHVVLCVTIATQQIVLTLLFCYFANLYR